MLSLMSRAGIQFFRRQAVEYVVTLCAMADKSSCPSSGALSHQRTAAKVSAARSYP